jgi:hypothetical protein
MTIGTDLDLDTSDLLYQTRLRELTSVSSRLSDLCTPFAEDIDLKSSMSPIRGDVKKEILPFLSRGRRSGLDPAQSQFWRGCKLAAY